jgi:hypothetical protein
VSIRNYGLFWRREEVLWNPGVGHDFRLIGRQGERNPALRLANFREQAGVYILYNNYGCYYVGIVPAGRLGDRLREHHEHHDDHRVTDWTRFSWFGFREVLQGRDESGFCKLREMPQVRIGCPEEWIHDIESLLIRAMGPSRQVRDECFTYEERWEQVGEEEIEHYQRRLGVIE